MNNGPELDARRGICIKNDKPLWLPLQLLGGKRNVVVDSTASNCGTLKALALEVLVVGSAGRFRSWRPCGHRSGALGAG